MGAWMIRLQDRWAGKNGMKPLSQEQIARLDELGMVWRNKFEGEPLACTG